MKKLCSFIVAHSWFFLTLRNISTQVCRQNQNTHFIFNFIFRKSWLLSDNVKKYVWRIYATDDNIMQCLCLECWLSKAGMQVQTVRFITYSCFTLQLLSELDSGWGLLTSTVATFYFISYCILRSNSYCCEIKILQPKNCYGNATHCYIMITNYLSSYFIYIFDNIRNCNNSAVWTGSDCC